VIASVRGRLTLWHTFVLAVLLVLFAGGAYTFVVRTSRARTDAAVRDAVNNLASELQAERPQQPTTLDAASEVLHELHFRQLAFVVYDTTGRAIAASLTRPASSAADGVELPLDTARLARAIRDHGITRATDVLAVPDAEGGYRAAVTYTTLPEGAYVLVAAAPVYVEAETLSDARRAMVVAIPLALALAALSGWYLARGALAPMVLMRERASRIGATNLAERVPIANAGDEVGQLATVINALLARLELAFVRQRQFMADASHELRTPVAVVQHEASLALSKPDRATAEYEESLTVVRDAGRRMRVIVDDLLLLASADAGEIPMRAAPLYLDDLVTECARAVRTLAQEREISVVVHVPEDVPYMGDESLLHRVVLNLLDNAIKFSPPGAVVTVTLSITADGYRLEVRDTGPGIPAEVQPHIFERFVRADSARSHDGTGASGAGLGLAIARRIAEAHGGSLELAGSTCDGSEFVLQLRPA
jgi:heavy metal sensor kinase